jgi:hypothetical protein
MKAADLFVAELDALNQALDSQRGHVLGILEGLSDQDLRRPVLPSGWSCLELVRHLTVDVELFWFAGVVAAKPDIAHQLRAGAHPHWEVPAGMSADEIFTDYRAAIERAKAVLAAAAQHVPRRTPRRGTRTDRQHHLAQLKVTVSSEISEPLQRTVIVPVPPLPSQANQSSSTSPEDAARLTVSVSEGGWAA